jgi:class 3 adenylate cyclase
LLVGRWPSGMEESVGELPSGTVTLLFADVEDSTRLVQQLGAGYGGVLGELRRLLRRAVAEAGGEEVDCRADELFAVFRGARDGVAAAVAAQQLVVRQAWPEGAQVRVRIGLHTGEPAVVGGAYLGVDVNRAARICAAGHGGGVLLSQTTRDLVGDGVELRDLGVFALAGLPRPERIFRIVVPGLRSDFPPLRVEAADKRRLRQRLPKGRSRKPTFEEAAWQVRALLPGAAPVLQEPLAKLGTELFVAHRALVGADGFLARIDRKRLAARLAAQREVTLVSPRARQEADSLEAKIACVDRLLDRRQALAELTPDLSPGLAESSEQIASLRGRLTRATAELDDAVMGAARALDPMSFKLGRTRHRGVYRSGRKYVVPFVDDLGAERRREFQTLSGAHNFLVGLRIAEKAQAAYVENWGDPYGHGGGGGS